MTDKIKELETKLEELKAEIEKLKDLETYYPISGSMVYDPNYRIPIKVLSVRRYEPKVGEDYCYLSDTGKVCVDKWYGGGIDFYRYSTDNVVCLDNEKLLEDKKKKDLIRQQLEDIALDLNKGVEIDWNDKNQKKYHLYISHIPFVNFHQSYETDYQVEGVTYCLSDKFLDAALKEIGEEKLKFLMGVE